jgi:hypothetical protein
MGNQGPKSPNLVQFHTVSHCFSSLSFLCFLCSLTDFSTKLAEFFSQELALYWSANKRHFTSIYSLLEINLSCCGIACLRNGSTVDNILREHQTLREMRWMAKLVPRLLALRHHFWVWIQTSLKNTKWAT